MIIHHHQRLLRCSCTCQGFTASCLGRELCTVVSAGGGWLWLSWPLSCAFTSCQVASFGSLETLVTKSTVIHEKLLSVPSILQLAHEIMGEGSRGWLWVGPLLTSSSLDRRQVQGDPSLLPTWPRDCNHYLATWRKSLFTPVPSLEASPSSTIMDKRRKCVLETSLVVSS